MEQVKRHWDVTLRIQVGSGVGSNEWVSSDVYWNQVRMYDANKSDACVLAKGEDDDHHYCDNCTKVPLVKETGFRLRIPYVLNIELYLSWDV